MYLFYSRWPQWTFDGTVKWARDCDYTGTHRESVPSADNECGGKCMATPWCKTFTWTTPQGGVGTCWMKEGGVVSRQIQGQHIGHVICGERLHR